MPPTPARKSHAERSPMSDGMLFTGLIVVLVLTNVWFFSQALPYAV